VMVLEEILPERFYTSFCASPLGLEPTVAYVLGTRKQRAVSR